MIYRTENRSQNSQNKCYAFQKMIAKSTRLVVNELRERVGDVMATMVEKLADLTDVMDRRMATLGEKLDADQWSTPPNSLPRQHNIATPRRPIKPARRTNCPFCSKMHCADPTNCGLKLRWASRMAIHKRRRLCADKTCYKSHAAPCLKANDVKCNHCGMSHLTLWCIYKAKEDGLL